MKQTPLYILVKRESPRLHYVARWLSEAWQTEVQVVTVLPAHAETALCYGMEQEGSLSIPDSGLLWEIGLRQTPPDTGLWEELLTFFPGEGTIPFDLFAAIFYLLSRYEEYLTFTPDRHGRYPATESILFKTGILRKPIIDLWLEKLRQLLQLPAPPFQRQQTYDIDRAYQIQHWPASRGWGLWLKALLKGNYSKAKEIRAVAAGNAKDPLDAFSFLEEWHQSLNIQLLNTQPIFFLLAAQKSSGNDVNLLPQSEGMQDLIRRLAGWATLGVHPSYRSSEQPALISAEKQTLETISSQCITASRQHFMRLRLPQTYRDLLAAGITDDFSMGYGSHLGFRAGTGRSFKWYDLSTEAERELRIHPFCFMDTTAHFYEKLTAAESFSVLQEMEADLKYCGSTLITVFHNYSLGTDPAWEGWQQAYAQWLSGN